MLLAYGKLSSRLDLIRRYLQANDEERQSTDQRRFAYIASISALYASFEMYAEESAFDFGRLLLSDPTNVAREHIDNLRRRYVQNSSSLLSKGLGTGRYSDITELDVATSLSSCLEDVGSYDLRLEIISLHNSNLRWDAFADLYRWAAPELSKEIQTSDAVRSWGTKTGVANTRVLPEVLVQELDDLVVRRNDVAHRAIPDEIISSERLLAKVNFIEAISLGLLASLSVKLIKLAVADGEGLSLGTPGEYLQQRRVVIIPSLLSPVSEGDSVWSASANIMRWGTVREIQVNDVRVAQADAGSEAGLLLDFAAPKGAAIRLWQNPSIDLFPPPDAVFGDWGPLPPS
ncbi:conserved hypothetical protein [uncultured Mycobacterium sp.]|uniref:RiboL-PSP-HEPN domain-containing protein n=1 Tax=uncultured Mycobacterium sp. TaxID=171292 RepID=A0A1Y5PKT3_9MYCO|nr:conserved hypothetical protein [uncultured Mycobacterium sp.]